MYKSLFCKDGLDGKYRIVLGYQEVRDGVVCHLSFMLGIEKKEYDRFLKTEQFPLVDNCGNKAWFNKDGRLHNIDGLAYIGNHSESYNIDGYELTEK